MRFDSKVTGRFEIFESAAPAVVTQITFIVQQKKLQPLRRCNWDLFYVYDFIMFM